MHSIADHCAEEGLVLRCDDAKGMFLTMANRGYANKVSSTSGGKFILHSPTAKAFPVIH
jgi:hypothetical protein